jgi:hypothetical protein
MSRLKTLYESLPPAVAVKVQPPNRNEIVTRRITLAPDLPTEISDEAINTAHKGDPDDTRGRSRRAAVDSRTADRKLCEAMEPHIAKLVDKIRHDHETVRGTVSMIQDLLPRNIETSDQFKMAPLEFLGDIG